MTTWHFAVGMLGAWLAVETGGDGCAASGGAGDAGGAGQTQGDDAATGDAAAGGDATTGDDATAGNDAKASNDATSGAVDATSPEDHDAPSVLALDAANLKLAGNGCSPADATITASGGSIVVAFHSVAVDLPANGAQTADRRACSIRVPAHVPRGYYLAQVVQSFAYRARKSSASSLSASAHVTLFSSNPAPLTESWARGSVVALASSASQTTDTGSTDYAAWCNANRAEDDVLGIDVAVSAQKDDASNEASIAIDGIDVRDGVELVFLPC